MSSPISPQSFLTTLYCSLSNLKTCKKKLPNNNTANDDMSKTVAPNDTQNNQLTLHFNVAFWLLLAHCFGFQVHKFSLHQPGQQHQATVFSKKSSRNPVPAQHQITDTVREQSRAFNSEQPNILFELVETKNRANRPVAS